MLREISKYWTSSSESYDKVIQTQFRSKTTINLWKQLLTKGLGIKSRQKVLDVGTGPGFSPSSYRRWDICLQPLMHLRG